MDIKLQEAIKKANAEVEKAEIADQELKKIAFSKAIDFYLYGADIKSQTNPQGIANDILKEPNTFWEVLGNSTGLEEKKLKDVYSTRGEQVLLVIPSIPGVLKADRQRNLAALILFAYQEGFGREWVTSTLLAEAANHSKLYDTSKFSKNLKSECFRTTGASKGLKYRLSGPGTKHAKDLLIKLIQ